MEFKTKELVYLIALAVLIATLGICSSLKGRVLPDKSPLVGADASLFIHVAGAVQQPGVYTLPAGSRIQDAITAAGGPLPEADIHRLNLAEILVDGKKIFVPAATAESATEGLININTASAKELATLPGIGPAKAQKIIDYREKFGPFSACEEITQVDTIGPKTYEAIKDLITF